MKSKTCLILWATCWLIGAGGGGGGGGGGMASGAASFVCFLLRLTLVAVFFGGVRFLGFFTSLTAGLDPSVAAPFVSVPESLGELTRSDEPGVSGEVSLDASALLGFAFLG